MLFILDQPIDEFTDEIQPACLPFNQSPIDYPPPNSTSLIAGWGRTNGTDDNSLANDLQNALNKVIDCKDFYTKSIKTTSIICSCIARRKLNFCMAKNIHYHGRFRSIQIVFRFSKNIMLILYIKPEIPQLFMTNFAWHFLSWSVFYV